MGFDSELFIRQLPPKHEETSVLKASHLAMGYFLDKLFGQFGNSIRKLIT